MANLPAALIQKGPSAKSADFPFWYTVTSTTAPQNVNYMYPDEHTTGGTGTTEKYFSNSLLMIPCGSDVISAGSGLNGLLREWDMAAAFSQGITALPVTALNLTNIKIGNSISQRIGRVIKMKSILVKGSFGVRTGILNTDTNVGQSGRVRIALVYDRQANAARPSFPDIFANIDTALNNQVNNTTTDTVTLTGYHYDVWSPPNPNNSYRFNILRDCRYDFQPCYNGSVDTSALAGKVIFQQFVTNQTYVEGNSCGFWKNTQGLETRYLKDDPIGPPLTNMISSGAIYLICYGELLAPNQPLKYVVQARVRFFDAL